MLWKYSPTNRALHLPGDFPQGRWTQATAGGVSPEGMIPGTDLPVGGGGWCGTEPDSERRALAYVAVHFQCVSQILQ